MLVDVKTNEIRTNSDQIFIPNYFCNTFVTLIQKQEFFPLPKSIRHLLQRETRKLPVLDRFSKILKKCFLYKQNEPILAIKCDIELWTKFHHLRVIARQHFTVLSDWPCKADHYRPKSIEIDHYRPKMTKIDWNQLKSTKNYVIWQKWS